MDEGASGGTANGPSANERFKDLWEKRVAWSTVAAVVFHAALVGFAGFQVVLPMLEPTPSQGRIVVLPPALAGGLSSAEQSSPTTLPEEDATEVDPTVGAGSTGSEERGAGEGSDAIDLWSAAAERLGYGEGFRPEIVEPEPERVTEIETESQPLSIDRIDAESALAELADADSVEVEMDLDRLAAFRPELAVMLPNLWILLRNPTQVDRFFERSYRRWELDRDWSGIVSVTVWIDNHGSVEWAEVSGSSGRGAVDEAALALFNEVVRFRPARQEGVPVSGSATFALLFPW